jgi:hypothetical protein
VAQSPDPGGVPRRNFLVGINATVATVADGKLVAKKEIVTMDVPARIAIVHNGLSSSVAGDAVHAHPRHGDAIRRPGQD